MKRGERLSFLIVGLLTLVSLPTVWTQLQSGIPVSFTATSAIASKQNSFGSNDGASTTLQTPALSSTNAAQAQVSYTTTQATSPVQPSNSVASMSAAQSGSPASGVASTSTTSGTKGTPLNTVDQPPITSTAAAAVVSPISSLLSSQATGVSSQQLSTSIAPVTQSTVTNLQSTAATFPTSTGGGSNLNTALTPPTPASTTPAAAVVISTGPVVSQNANNASAVTSTTTPSTTTPSLAQTTQRVLFVTPNNYDDAIHGVLSYATTVRTVVSTVLSNTTNTVPLPVNTTGGPVVFTTVVPTVITTTKFVNITAYALSFASSIAAAAANVNQSRIIDTTVDKNADGNMVIKCGILDGVNPTAAEAVASLKQKSGRSRRDVSNQLILYDMYNQTLSTTKIYNWTAAGPCPNASCRNSGVCQCSANGVFYCDCPKTVSYPMDNQCLPISQSVSSKSCRDRPECIIPAIVVPVVGTVLILALIIAICCCCCCRSEGGYKRPLFSYVRSSAVNPIYEMRNQDVHVATLTNDVGATNTLSNGTTRSKVKRQNSKHENGTSNGNGYYTNVVSISSDSTLCHNDATMMSSHELSY